jgi:phage terminase small subunit
MPDIKETIRKAYEIGDGTFKFLSEKYSVSEGTIKSWSKQDKDKGQPWIKPTQPQPKNQTQEVEFKVEEKVEVEIVNNLAIKEDEKIVGLTEKQRFFVAEYLKDFNATRAALAVGYSKHTAMEQGYQLLHKTSVQAELKRQTEVLFDSIGLTQQRILMEYMKIAGADINNYLDFGQREVPVLKDGKPVLDSRGNPVTKIINYVDFKDSSEVDTSLIQEVKMGKDGASIKLYDKQRALDTLAKYMNIITGGISVNIQQNNINITLEDD